MLATSFRCRISTALKRACARARESQRSFENLRSSEHLRRQTSVTTTGPQLPAPHTPQPPAPAHSLNQPLTLAEVEVGLQHLHNGRSGALHGYTSELLRYAQLVTTPDDPAPAHLLAPCLVVFFSTGQVPQSWKTSLVTPVFKHGHATDTANYRPISVGEPISRLYANIMIQRLVTYTEQQQLRSAT